ncbi:MAG TPA: efflux RND transporter periplasmic adaptor subunit [Opitutaceae bacterium]|nr:efflux RND transporter periplasmic adaptor subunit [Opitutaceae bacterium]
MSEPQPSLDGLRIQRDAKPPRRSPIGVAVGAVVAIVVICAAVWWFTRSTAIPVHTAVAREVSSGGGDLTVLNASGYVTARREATVSSKVTGKVNEILIEEGMKVTEGQVLARIDDTNVRASLQLAQAQEQSARAALDETRVRLREAEQELQRQTDLLHRRVATQADFDHAQAAALAYRAHLEQQQADVAVAARSAAVWQQQLDDTVIRAPFAGTVTSKNAQPGEMISPMSTGGFTRTGICTIVDMDSLEIEIDVNESYINRVTAGQPVEAVLDAYPDWRIPCHVIAIIPTADRNKSTVKVRVGFNQLDPRILPDMSVKVAFRDTAAGAAIAKRGVIVPRAAIEQQGDRTVVMVVSAGRIERRAVSLARREGDDALVTSGLTAGEKVVIDPPAKLRDGDRVNELTP